MAADRAGGPGDQVENAGITRRSAARAKQWPQRSPGFPHLLVRPAVTRSRVLGNAAGIRFVWAFARGRRVILRAPEASDTGRHGTPMTEQDDEELEDDEPELDEDDARRRAEEIDEELDEDLDDTDLDGRSTTSTPSVVADRRSRRRGRAGRAATAEPARRRGRGRPRPRRGAAPRRRRGAPRRAAPGAHRRRDARGRGGGGRGRGGRDRRARRGPARIVPAAPGRVPLPVVLPRAAAQPARRRETDALPRLRVTPACASLFALMTTSVTEAASRAADEPVARLPERRRQRWRPHWPRWDASVRWRIVASIASAILLGLAFPALDLGPLALVGAGAAAVGVARRDPAKAALYGFFFGVAFFGDPPRRGSWYFGPSPIVPLVLAGGRVHRRAGCRRRRLRRASVSGRRGSSPRSGCSSRSCEAGCRSAGCRGASPAPRCTTSRCARARELGRRRAGHVPGRRRQRPARRRAAGCPRTHGASAGVRGAGLAVVVVAVVALGHAFRYDPTVDRAGCGSRRSRATTRTATHDPLEFEASPGRAALRARRHARGSLRPHRVPGVVARPRPRAGPGAPRAHHGHRRRARVGDARQRAASPRPTAATTTRTCSTSPTATCRAPTPSSTSCRSASTCRCATSSTSPGHPRADPVRLRPRERTRALRGQRPPGRRRSSASSRRSRRSCATSCATAPRSSS